MQSLAEVEETWVDKALQEGRQEGRQEDMHTLLLSMLSHKFGTLPDEFIRQINAITDQHILTQISNQILDAGHLSEIVLPPLDEEQSQTGE